MLSKFYIPINFNGKFTNLVGNNNSVGLKPPENNEFNIGN